MGVKIIELYTSFIFVEEQRSVLDPPHLRTSLHIVRGTLGWNNIFDLGSSFDQKKNIYTSQTSPPHGLASLVPRQRISQRRTISST